MEGKLIWLRVGFFAPSIIEHEGASQAQSTNKEIPHHPATNSSELPNGVRCGDRSMCGLGTYVVV